MPLRVRATIAVLAALLLSGAGPGGARAESEWLQKSFSDPSPEVSKTRRAKPPLTRPAKSAKRSNEDVAAERRDRQRQAEREAEDNAARVRASALAKLDEERRQQEARAPHFKPQIAPQSGPDAQARMQLGVTAPADPPALVPPPPPLSQPALETGNAGPTAGKPKVLPTDTAVAAPAPPRSLPEAAPPPAKGEPVRPAAVVEQPRPVVTATLPAANPGPQARPIPLQEDNTPADARTTAIARGKELWHVRRGVRSTSMEGCDLGLGPGRVVGTFAHMPRHFADSGRVMDLESRLLWCAQMQQEIDPAALMKPRAIDGGIATELEDLATYVASLSISWRLSSPMEHAKERQAHSIGQALYARRQGPLDFSCATCHGPVGAGNGSPQQPEARIQSVKLWQGQAVPQFGQPHEAQAAIANWPAWTATQGAVRTLQFRLGSCFGNMGMQPPAPGSEAMVALISYLTKLAEKGEVFAPRRKP